MLTWIANLSSAFVLLVAAVAVATPCTLYFYQPKAPENMKAYLREMRNR